MIGPVRVFLVLRESPQLGSLAAIVAVSALFAATPFIIPAVALEYSVSLGRSGLLSAAQVGGFAVAVFVAGRRLRTHRAYLNGEIFYTLPEAVVLVEQWRRLYNTVRPHSAPGARSTAPPRRRSNHRLGSLECPSSRDRRWLNG